MDEKSEGGRKNGGGNDTDDTKEEETIRAIDNRDTENGVDQNVDDGIKTEDPEVLPRRETTSEQPYETLPPGNDNAPPTEESEFQENARRVETKAEVKGPIDEALGKTGQTKASNSEEQSDPDSSQADPGTDQGETSRTEQYEDGVSPQTPADSPTELEGKKAIKEPSKKTPDAPTAQSIKRNNMEDSSSNGTQEALSGSGAEGQREAVQTSDGHNVTSPSKSVQPTTTGSDPLTDNRKSSPSGGIPDSKLEKLAKALPGEEYRNACSLGQTLGFSLTKLNGYCGYGGKPKDSSGILRMLRDWKEKTRDEKQLSGLLEALNKANLKHLAGDLRSQEGAEVQREAVQTSDGDSVTSPSKSVQPTTTGSDPLTDNRKSSPSVVPGAGPNPNKEDAPRESSGKTDKEESNEPQIAGSSSKPKDTKPETVEQEADPGPDTKGTLLERSVKTYKEEKGEPQTTDSSSKPKEPKPKTEARPDRDTECASLEGSKKTDEEERREQQTTDSSTESKGTKPKTVPRNSTTNPTTPDRNSGYKDPKDKGGARERKAKEKPEEEKEAEEQKVSKEGAATTDDGTKEDGTTKQKTNGGRVGGKGTKLPAEDAEEPFEPVSKERPVSISVCTSAYDFNVKGLVSFLKDLMYSHPKLIKEVKVHALPYNDLDHYKFPKENPVDVMLLCHSINNRRFAITDVMDALYDEYLPYCARVVGKNKMGVIVHDFEDMRETVQSSRMSSFKYKQPKAFETTSLQIICGHIEKEEKDLNQMLKVDREKLPVFLKNASTCPEEMMNQITEKQGLKQKAKDGIVTFGNQVSSSIRSFGESMTSLRWSQDSTSEGSRVDPREVDRNDQGTTCSAKTEDNKTKRSANKRKPSSEQAKRPCLAKKNTSGGSHQKPKASMDERNLNPPSTSEASFIGERRLGTTIAAAAAHTQGAPDQQSMAAGRNVTSAPQGSHATSSPRRISISVCSSAYEHNVKGFVSKLTELQTRPPHLIADVRFRSLPYNDIDSFKFPSSDPVDVMVLCHSVQNRGFSITNVLNALYEKHLQYCHDVIGKKKLAVIVHDFSDCKPKTLEVRMESFKRSQPLTFELVDTVIVCGSLEKPGKIEMRDEDMTRLTTFFEQARYEQRENYAVKQSFYKKSFLGGLW